MAIIQGEGVEFPEAPLKEWNGATHQGWLRFQTFRSDRSEPLTDAVIGHGMMSPVGSGLPAFSIRDAPSRSQAGARFHSAGDRPVGGLKKKWGDITTGATRTPQPGVVLPPTSDTKSEQSAGASAKEEPGPVPGKGV